MSLSPFGKGFQVSLTDLQDEFNHMLDRMWHGGISTRPLDGQSWAPAIDVFDEPTQFVLTAEVPGLSVDDIEVLCENDEVVIRGHKVAAREEEEGIACVRRERRYGDFCRRIPLSEAVKEDGVTACCRQGVLEIVLPKKDLPERKTVKIEVVE